MADLPEVLTIALLAGCATGLGAVPSLMTDRISHRVYDGSLGLAAGIMFGAAIFALVLPSLDGDFDGFWLGPFPEVIAGILVGGGALLGANRLLPHLHLWFTGPGVHGTKDPDATRAATQSVEDWRQAVLIGGSITLHNVPEGLAIGVAFASGVEGAGLALAVAIAIQNVPDGFAMAVPASRAGVSKGKTFLYTTLSGGLPEPVAAAVGFALVSVVTDVFPIAAGFAAGTMIAVIFREMIPSSHGHGHADLATAAFLAGFVIMMTVDIVLAV